MIPEAENFIAHIGDVSGNVGGIGAVQRIGLEEFVPHQEAVLVAKFVEVLAGALAHPVANQIQVGQLVQPDLGVQPCAWNPLQRFIESPVAAANEDGHAVDGDGQRVGAGNGVADFSHAEFHILCVGDGAAGPEFPDFEFRGFEFEMQLVHLLRAVAVGPPQARMFHVERRRAFRVKGNLLRCVGRERNLPLEDDVLDRAPHNAINRLIGHVFDGCLHCNVGRIGFGQRQIRGDERVFHHYRTCG